MSDWKNVQYKDGKMRTSSGGGGGGASNFADLDDVSFSNIQNGQVPKYNSTTQKWENANESGGGGLTRTVIYTGNDQPTYYQLTQPLTNFDAIAVFIMTGAYYTSNIFLTDELMEKVGIDARFGTFSDAAYIYFSVVDASTLKRENTNAFLIYKIVGLKY